MRSPIESMVDQACGVTPESLAAAEERKKAAQEATTERLLAVCDAALWWWRMHRPVGWKRGQHVHNPIVNCKGDHEKMLAEACAWLSLEGWPIENPATKRKQPSTCTTNERTER